MNKTAMVLGAMDGIGGEVARLLLACGWRVKALHRQSRRGDGLEWIVGDAMNGDDVVQAAQGALEHTIAAARGFCCLALCTTLARTHSRLSRTMRLSGR